LVAGSGDPLHDQHLSLTTHRAEPQLRLLTGRRLPSPRSIIPHWRVITYFQQAAAEFKILLSASIRHQTIMTNSDESPWEHVLQKAPGEFRCREPHRFSHVAGGIVFPAKGDLAIGERQQAPVGDRDLMSVACQILQDLLGPAERRLGIDDPLHPTQLLQPPGKLPGVCQVAQLPGEKQPLLLTRLPQVTNELPPEQTAEHFNGQKETLPAGDPSGMIWRSSAARHDTVQVRMMEPTIIIPQI
jgi:hypothetical protein